MLPPRASSARKAVMCAAILPQLLRYFSIKRRIFEELLPDFKYLCPSMKPIIIDKMMANKHQEPRQQSLHE